jgi:hypothetical protein
VVSAWVVSSPDYRGTFVTASIDIALCTNGAHRIFIRTNSMRVPAVAQARVEQLNSVASCTTHGKPKP